MTAVDYAMLFARSLKDDAIIGAMLQDSYGREPYVDVGYKQDMQEWQKITPFLTFVPNITEDDESGIKSRVWLYMGVYDKEEVENGGVLVMRAYPMLSKIAERVRTVIARECRAVYPTTEVSGFDVEFRQENYPLMWAVADITVFEHIAVGSFGPGR